MSIYSTRGPTALCPIVPLHLGVCVATHHSAPLGVKPTPDPIAPSRLTAAETNVGDFSLTNTQQIAENATIDFRGISFQLVGLFVVEQAGSSLPRKF